MPEDSNPIPSSELRSLARTITELPTGAPQLVPRLQFIADLLNTLGPFPPGPLLAWRTGDRKVQHLVIGPKLTFGRHPGEPGLALPDDKLLSGTHFEITTSGADCELRDLNSRNGTAVNVPGVRVSRKWLLNGDFIHAGNHVFVFLDQRQVNS